MLSSPISSIYRGIILTPADLRKLKAVRQYDYDTTSQVSDNLNGTQDKSFYIDHIASVNASRPGTDNVVFYPNNNDTSISLTLFTTPETVIAGSNKVAGMLDQFPLLFEGAGILQIVGSIGFESGDSTKYTFSYWEINTEDLHAHLAEKMP